MEVADDHVTFQAPDGTWLCAKFREIGAVSWDAVYIYMWRNNCDKHLYVPRGEISDNRLHNMRLTWLRCKDKI